MDAYSLLFDDRFENWNGNTFNWKDGSRPLAKFCNRNFNIWWDPERFDWGSGSIELAEHCYEHFEIWWDDKKFDWSHDVIALKKCFYELYEPDMVVHDVEYLLETNCPEYKHIWKREGYVISKLSN